MQYRFILQTASIILLAVSLTASKAPRVPSLNVPACPKQAQIEYNKSVPKLTDFPSTTVDLCYGVSTLELVFTAYKETSFYYNPSHKTNDDLYKYEVMEAFISRGTNDPQTYLEIEISPANVTYQSFIYNPGKGIETNTAFDNILIPTPVADGFSARTSLNKQKQIWISQFSVPLGLFNVEKDSAKGTHWRMNFFRTVTNATYFPNQVLGAWSPSNKPNFHITPYFGHIRFV
ncbi:hypothetical protein CROQUDRAFT_37509 [Cronartium quercuum f. sp. fusiforme G11]|uniref:Carbohydrate-binding domain-containing protein n=1 Tax=Cronartium quercuum f. sp. fusiforme G11 TaxID=708437 RepID=A0A9P6NV63_9BASI|nr:hypothetical protein CROQUDRAFT_37509 [Cronartium quercuum f. sp. fusiforme G11]